jgi:hypothetical protein
MIKGSLNGTLAPSVFRVPERCPSADTAKAQQRHRLTGYTAERHRWQGYGSMATKAIKCLRACAERVPEGGKRARWLAGWLAGWQRVGQRRLEGCCMLAVVAPSGQSSSAHACIQILPEFCLTGPMSFVLNGGWLHDTQSHSVSSVNAMRCDAMRDARCVAAYLPGRPCPRVQESASRPPGHTRSGLRKA